jgi:hypothetical protein
MAGTVDHGERCETRVSSTCSRWRQVRIVHEVFCRLANATEEVDYSLQSRREAYFESWAESAGSRYCLKWYELHVPLWWEGVEDLEEVVEVVERAVWLGRVRIGFVISSEGWNEVIPSEWTAAAGLASASPAPSLACNRIIPLSHS